MTYIPGILRSIYFATPPARRKRKDLYRREEERNVYGELVVIGKRTKPMGVSSLPEELLDIEEDIKS
jgi:hypothetical protein|tara:strand:+ start:444 stop:644 length:201 start_codon:yes stop_codon:yes gene_type:complete